MKYIILLIMVLQIGYVAASGQHNRRLDPEPNRLNGVRFDPSYYYNAKVNAKKLCENLVEKWKEHGVNTVFFKVYDPIHGAKYRTDYPLNIMADYGRQDLLKHMIRAADKNNIDIYAWIPAFQHKTAWTEKPEWRVRLQPGTDYKPTEDSFFLCPAHPEVRNWWLGFIDELLDRYERLRGIDVAEPIISWSGSKCHCVHCSLSKKSIDPTNPSYSSEGMTLTLEQTIRQIREKKFRVSITTVASVSEEGGLLTNEEQAGLTGFDLEAILSGSSPPDYISLELMWQQWAERFNDKNTFSPEWVAHAAKEAIRVIDRRSRIIAHIERTSFGSYDITNQQFLQSIMYAKNAGLQDLDVYDTHLLDSTGAWNQYKEAAEYMPTRQVIIVHDPQGENDARQIASLLSHFKTAIQLINFETFEQLSGEKLQFTDQLFITGVEQGYRLSDKVLSNIRSFKGEICWLNFGIEQYANAVGEEHLGFRFEAVIKDSSYNQVLFRDIALPKTDPVYNRVVVEDSSNTRVLSWLTDGRNHEPYILRSGNFWYVADLPTAYVVEGGRHIVFSDLLHEIMREDHLPKKLALVRIEDVHPLSDPEALEHLAGFFKSEDIPFSVSVVPYYLEPQSNTNVAMFDRPRFVEAIKEMQGAGGCVVMHGTTHQYRGETTADYEFWDMMADAPLFSDSKEFVRQRLITGLNEFMRNGIFPLVWETPHYGASQLDYKIINTYFSTGYERRQTIDMHGSDQLLPYLIYNHTAGGKIIPENLGYVPLSNPDPSDIVKAARNNLLIRDGVASFFFHPFVNHDVLEQIVEQFKNMGFVFTNPQWTDNKVKFDDFVFLSGENEAGLELDNEYYAEYFFDEDYDIEDKIISDSALTKRYTRKVSVEPGWTYLLRKLKNKPESYITSLFSGLTDRLSFSPITGLTEATQLQLAEGEAISACMIYNNNAADTFATSQQNLINALHSVGVSVDKIGVNEFLELPDNANLVIIPRAATESMNEQQRLFVIKALQNGLNVVFEGMSQITRDIGIYPLEGVEKVQQVRDEYYPQVNIKWTEPEHVDQFDIDIEYVSYYSNVETDAPLIVGGEYGNGKYLYMATLFDPDTELGYGRYPFFIDLLDRQFKLRPAVSRHQVEIYFEPGDREDISIEDLIKTWRSNGVKRIYVSSWHFYDDYEYNYSRLIELAHQNAMNVYAWLELPHVSQKFWNDHPEWREITATGQEAHTGWRHNMALNIPACRDSVSAFLNHLLLHYDWDGVNFANLYYESHAGIEIPDQFTPMNSFIRTSFEELHGFDPANLLNPSSKHYWKQNSDDLNTFMTYREDRLFELYEYFLNFLFDLRKKENRNWEIMVTLVDDTSEPVIAKNIAIDSQRLINLGRQLPFSVQVESPKMIWSLKMENYQKLHHKYQQNEGKVPFVYNVNVIPSGENRTTFSPTYQPTGIELYQAISRANRQSNRVAFYSESSIYEIDFPMLAYALASETHEKFTDTGLQVSSDLTTHVQLNSETHKDVLLNDNIWPGYYKGSLILPPGQHTIRAVSQMNKLSDWLRSGTRLVDLSGELLDARMLSRGIELKVYNPFHGRLIVSEKPLKIELDNRVTALKTVRGDRGYSISIPAGEHDLKIYTHRISAVFIKQASVILSFFIVLAGSGAILLLVIIYIRNLLRRIFTKQYA